MQAIGAPARPKYNSSRYKEAVTQTAGTLGKGHADHSAKQASPSGHVRGAPGPYYDLSAPETAVAGVPEKLGKFQEAALVMHCVCMPGAGKRDEEVLATFKQQRLTPDILREGLVLNLCNVLASLAQELGSFHQTNSQRAYKSAR